MPWKSSTPGVTPSSVTFTVVPSLSPSKRTMPTRSPLDVRGVQPWRPSRVPRPVRRPPAQASPPLRWTPLRPLRRPCATASSGSCRATHVLHPFGSPRPQECSCTRSDRRALAITGDRLDEFSSSPSASDISPPACRPRRASIVCEGMTPAIEIEGLRKVYRQRGQDVCAVDGLDLSVPEGGVFGFLGPNGSGKTTTIRSLLGLVRATSGRMSILGHPTPQALSASCGTSARSWRHRRCSRR